MAHSDHEREIIYEKSASIKGYFYVNSSENEKINLVRLRTAHFA